MIEKFITLLESDDRQVAFQIAQVIAKVAAGGGTEVTASTIQKLWLLSASNDEEIAYNASYAIGKVAQGVCTYDTTSYKDETAMDKVVAIIIEKLNTILESRDRSKAYHAAIAISYVAQNWRIEVADSIIEKLSVMVSNGNNDTASRVLEAIGKVAERAHGIKAEVASSTIEKLSILLGGEDSNIAFRATEAIDNVAKRVRGEKTEVTPSTIEKLSILLGGEDSNIAFRAIEAIGNVAQGGRAEIAAIAIEKLSALLSDYTTYYAIETIDKVHERAGDKVALNTIKKLWLSDSKIISSTVEAIGKATQGRGSEVALSTIEKLSVLLGSEDTDIASSAASVIGNVVGAGG